MARELFFYNSSSGEFATGRVDADGNYAGLAGGGLSPGWAHVVAVAE